MVMDSRSGTKIAPTFDQPSSVCVAGTVHHAGVDGSGAPKVTAGAGRRRLAVRFSLLSLLRGDLAPVGSRQRSACRTARQPERRAHGSLPSEHLLADVGQHGERRRPHGAMSAGADCSWSSSSSAAVGCYSMTQLCCETTAPHGLRERRPQRMAQSTLGLTAP